MPHPPGIGSVQSLGRHDSAHGPQRPTAVPPSRISLKYALGATEVGQGSLALFSPHTSSETGVGMPTLPM